MTSYIIRKDSSDTVKAFIYIRHVSPRWRKGFGIANVSFPQVSGTLQPELYPIQGYTEQLDIDFEIYDSDEDMSNGYAGSPVRTKKEQIAYIRNEVSAGLLTDKYQVYIDGWDMTFTGYISTWNITETADRKVARGSISLLVGNLVLS